MKLAGVGAGRRPSPRSRGSPNRTGGSPLGIEGERFTALVYESIDPPTAIAAWRRYVLALSQEPRPTALQLNQLADGLAALAALTRGPAAVPAPATPPGAR